MEKSYSKEDRKAKRTVREKRLRPTEDEGGRNCSPGGPGDHSRACEPGNWEQRGRQRGRRGEGGERKATGELEPEQSREGSEREALIMDGGWKHRAACLKSGEKHQRERGEANGTRGDTRGAALSSGPPGPPAHPPRPRPPAPSPPPSTGQGSEPPGPQPGRASALAQALLLPSPHPRGMAGFWSQGLPGLGRGQASLMVPVTTTSLSISQKIGPSIPQTHIWGPEMGSKPPSFRPAPVHMICLSSNPEKLTLETPRSQPGRGFQPFSATRLGVGECLQMASDHPLSQASKSAVLEPPQEAFSKECVFLLFLICPLRSSASSG